VHVPRVDIRRTGTSTVASDDFTRAHVAANRPLLSLARRYARTRPDDRAKVTLRGGGDPGRRLKAQVPRHTAREYEGVLLPRRFAVMISDDRSRRR